MANLGYVSSFNINGNELSLKDAGLTEIVEEIIEAIGANNGDISARINNLHDRSFDALIKISSQNESEISNIQDGIYKLQYVTVTGEGDNTTETLNQSSILIQWTSNNIVNQHLYSRSSGTVSKRQKINNTWSNWSINSDAFGLSIIINEDNEEIRRGKFHDYIYKNIPKELYGLWTQIGLIIKFEVTSNNNSDIFIYTKNLEEYYFNIQTDISIEIDDETGDPRIIVGEVIYSLENESKHHSLYNSIGQEKFLDICAGFRELFESLNINIIRYIFESYHESNYNIDNYIISNNLSIGYLIDEGVTSVNGQTGAVTITETQLSKGTATGAGNAVTDINVSNHQITLVKGATYATQNDIDTSIAAFVDSAPETLDTLNELAAALNDDPNFATTVATQIGQKYTKPSTGIPSTDLADNVQTNLTLASTALQSFTETDPTVPSHVKNITSQDITNWNNKLSSAPVTSVNGETGAVTLALGDTNVIETIKVNNSALTPVSKEVNITVPTKVSDLTNDSNFTSNTGTITGITMNGVSKGTSGVVNLGTVLTEHQDISGKVDKVTGMGLSSNDYTTTEKNKLAGINIGSLDSLTTAELNSIFS